jgi:hypothetical protein
MKGLRAGKGRKAIDRFLDIFVVFFLFFNVLSIGYVLTLLTIPISVGTLELDLGQVSGVLNKLSEDLTLTQKSPQNVHTTD